MYGDFLALGYKYAEDFLQFATERKSRHNVCTIGSAITRPPSDNRMGTIETKNECINTHITEAATHSGTETESVTVGNKHHVEIETTAHQNSTSLFAAIQCANAMMHKHGNDAACLGLDERQWASDADIALQDDYDGMMRYLYEYDDGSGYHPYFCQPVERYTSGEHF